MGFSAAQGRAGSGKSQDSTPRFVVFGEDGVGELAMAALDAVESLPKADNPAGQIQRLKV
ncbi:MAG: hypothetical protein WBM24_21650 [Candidatus Sulfotelmatobacter sp.]